MGGTGRWWCPGHKLSAGPCGHAGQTPDLAWVPGKASERPDDIWLDPGGARELSRRKEVGRASVLCPLGFSLAHGGVRTQGGVCRGRGCLCGTTLCPHRVWGIRRCWAQHPLTSPRPCSSLQVTPPAQSRGGGEPGAGVGGLTEQSRAGRGQPHGRSLQRYPPAGWRAPASWGLW